MKALDNVSFDAYAGEILGIAGIAGSGQKELCETIAGLYPSVGGSVLYSESSEKGAVKERILGLSPDESPKKEFQWHLFRKIVLEWVLLPEWI